MHRSCRAWRRARHTFGDFGGCGVREGCSPEGREFAGPDYEGHVGRGGGGFGIRRPMRFLAHQLELDDAQIAVLAKILDELKTERAQAEVNRRMSVAAYADALTADTFDTGKVSEGGNLRVKSAERLRDAILKALQELHAVLKPDQRTRLVYLMRTGRLEI